MKAKGITVVKTPNSMIGSKKNKLNDKHFKEQYAYRKPKKIFGVPATMTKPATLSINNEEAREEAWRNYIDIKDRMLNWDGEIVASIIKKISLLLRSKSTVCPNEL